MAKKQYDEDDGRTIVDMSGVGDDSLFSLGKISRKDFQNPDDEKKSKNPYDYSPDITREERRWYILGALKAALLIGGAFIVGLGLLVFLLTLIWV